MAAFGCSGPCAFSAIASAPWTKVPREQGALLGMSPEEFTKQRHAQVPLGRMERPEDVAQVIRFLVSPRAGYMTGQAFKVDGGLVMH